MEPLMSNMLLLDHDLNFRISTSIILLGYIEDIRDYVLHQAC